MVSGPTKPSGCSGNHRTCFVASGHTAPCLQLVRNRQDLLYCIMTHCSLPASAQGPTGHVVLFQDPLPATDQRTAGPVLSFLDPLPSACHFSENHRTCAFVSGYTACLCSWTCRTVVSSRQPLPPTCYCSESRRTFGVVMGTTGTCLALLWNP